MRGLKGKVAVVTGGSRGIGRAIVERLLEEGVKVVFNGRNEKVGMAALEDFRKISPDVEFLAGDMELRQTAHDLVAYAIAKWGQLDFVCNNAFPFTAKGIDATEEEWIHTFKAGPIAYANMIAEFVAQRGRGKGAVCCTSSISANIAQIDRWTYNVAKGAVSQLIKCAALDLPEIRINAYLPSWVMTDEVLKATPDGTWESTPQAWKDYHMYGRLQTPEEMAGIVAFLLSDDASAITGANIDATGGYLSMGPEGRGKDSNFAGSN